MRSSRLWAWGSLAMRFAGLFGAKRRGSRQEESDAERADRDGANFGKRSERPDPGAAPTLRIEPGASRRVPRTLSPPLPE
jgi:hypothetical protein